MVTVNLRSIYIRCSKELLKVIDFSLTLSMERFLFGQYLRMVKPHANRSNHEEDHERHEGMGRPQRQSHRRVFPRLRVLLCQENGHQVRPPDRSNVARDGGQAARRGQVS